MKKVPNHRRKRTFIQCSVLLLVPFPTAESLLGRPAPQRHRGTTPHRRRDRVAKIIRACASTSPSNNVEEQEAIAAASSDDALPATNRKKATNKRTPKSATKVPQKKSDAKSEEDAEVPPPKATKKRTKSKAKKADTGPLHWINETDDFTICVQQASPSSTSEEAEGPICYTSLADYHQSIIRDKTADDMVLATSSSVVSLSLTVRGNPLPLRRHRTSRGFVYNPSAPAQASFRSQVGELVFGVDDDYDNNNTYEGNIDKQQSPMRSIRHLIVTPLFPANTALAVTLVLRLKRPLSHFRASKRERGILKDQAPASMTCLTRTDADNLAKFVLDACNGLLYGDDRQIQSLHVIKKLDNDEQCLGSTQLLIKAIDDSSEDYLLRHALDPYSRPK